MGSFQPPQEFMGRFGYPRDRAGQEIIDQMPAQLLTPDPDTLEMAKGSTVAAVTARLENPEKSAPIGRIGAGAYSREKKVPSRRKR